MCTIYIYIYIELTTDYPMLGRGCNHGYANLADNMKHFQNDNKNASFYS